MQHYGYTYCSEDTGTFGTRDPRPTPWFRMDNLSIWVESLISFDAPKLQAAGAAPDAVFLQGLAYQMMSIYSCRQREAQF